MRKLLILSVLLMALFVYAVPTDNEVGAGYLVSFEEDGGCAVLASVLLADLTAFEDGGFAVLQFEEEGYLIEGNAILSATNGNGSATHSILNQPKTSHRTTPTIILRC